jgi:dipeptidyl aminopeptidase/acylaminoacyl peptidase
MPHPSGRRAFLGSAAALGGAWWLPRGAWAQGAPDALVPRRLYSVEPDFGNVRISPDGSQLAYLAPVNGIRNLFVAPVGEPRQGRQVTRVTDRNIGWFYQWAYTGRHLLFFQDRDGDENWRASSVEVSSGTLRALTPERGVRALFQETSHRFPEEILLRHNGRDRSYFDLYRISLVTGASSLVYENRTFSWFITDSAFRLRLGARYAADGSLELDERRGDAWVPFIKVPIGDLDGTRLIDFSADGKILYMIDTRGRDKAALVAIDMASGAMRVLAEDAEADIVRAELDERTRAPYAALAVRARKRWHALDAQTKADLGRLASLDGDVEFVSRTLDGRRATVFYERDASSGEFALLDRASGRVTPLYKARAAHDRIGLRRMQPVVIRARDGLDLHGYLTLPKDGAERVPLVLAIHGGPYWRDSWGYSSSHQLLANRGYAVLSVNFRGSTGFGKAFVTAADGEWGGRMHDDLIDAVDWAIAQGIADPKRVCAYGASYGGYAALVCATRTPERFACIVDIFGISNLLTFMATIPPYWKPWFSVWKKRVGDPDTEQGRAFLRSRSPLFNLERATRPILIIQGMQDVRVVAAESEQMVAALKDKGAPVTYISFPDEGHGFSREPNRFAIDAIVEAFLARHLGGRYQPIGDDFAGSSLRVLTGAQLVPGLAESLKT